MKAQNTNPFRFSCGHCHQLVGSVHVILQILTRHTSQGPPLLQPRVCRFVASQRPVAPARLRRAEPDWTPPPPQVTIGQVRSYCPEMHHTCQPSQPKRATL